MTEKRYEDFVLFFNHEGQRACWWFRAEAPIPWLEARDRLIHAGLVRASDAGGFLGRHWVLSVDSVTIEMHKRQLTEPRPLP